MKTLGYAVVMLLTLPAPLRAHQVYSGCAVPSATPRHVWYVDPVHGKTPAAGGSGSQASPWNSLSGIISGNWAANGFSIPGYTRPLLSSVPYYHITSAGRIDVADKLGNPPVQPGDTIYLMSGNYGDIGLGSFDLPTTNSDFVTVQAAPIAGQVPFNPLYPLNEQMGVQRHQGAESFGARTTTPTRLSRLRTKARRSQPKISSWRICSLARPTASPG